MPLRPGHKLSLGMSSSLFGIVIPESLGDCLKPLKGEENCIRPPLWIIEQVGLYCAGWGKRYADLGRFRWWYRLHPACFKDYIYSHYHELTKEISLLGLSLARKSEFATSYRRVFYYLSKVLPRYVYAKGLIWSFTIPAAQFK
jgi:hypothetical protein